ERFERANHYLGNRKVTKPLVIGRDDVPGRFFGAAFRNGVLVGGLVVIPEFALGEVGGGSLPVFAGVGQALFEALLLLLTAHVQEKFEDTNIVISQGPFKGIDF